MKILNLYAGLGGNRKHWRGHDITAVEIDERIGKVYQDQYPNDRLIIGDAHGFLLDHLNEFDFIWSSPPCQSHCRFNRSGRNRKLRYPDMRLYEEILLLRHDCNSLWVVENVVPYYQAMLNPVRIDRHLFWSNFYINEMSVPARRPLFKATQSELKQELGIHYEGSIYYGNNHSPEQVLRNCVSPSLGQHVLKCAVNGIKKIG